MNKYRINDNKKCRDEQEFQKSCKEIKICFLVSVMVQKRSCFGFKNLFFEAQFQLEMQRCLGN